MFLEEAELSFPASGTVPGVKECVYSFIKWSEPITMVDMKGKKKIIYIIHMRKRFFVSLVKPLIQFQIRKQKSCTNFVDITLTTRMAVDGMVHSESQSELSVGV